MDDGGVKNASMSLPVLVGGAGWPRGQAEKQSPGCALGAKLIDAPRVRVNRPRNRIEQAIFLAGTKWHKCTARLASSSSGLLHLGPPSSCCYIQTLRRPSIDITRQPAGERERDSPSPAREMNSCSAGQLQVSLRCLGAKREARFHSSFSAIDHQDPPAR